MVKYISQLRRGTAEEWAVSNIIPLEGEMVAEIDKKNHRQTFKIGDGIHTYPQLAYLTAGDSVITQSLIRAASITLYPDRWVQDSNDRWYQTPEIVEISISNKDKMDLQPSSEQLCIFHEKDIAFVTENNDGVILVYCIGQVPQNEYTLQATITEVEIDGKIIGDTTATPNPRPDWNQTDVMKADYIKNKPLLGSLAAKDVVEKSDLSQEVQDALSGIGGITNSMFVNNETLVINFNNNPEE